MLRTQIFLIDCKMYYPLTIGENMITVNRMRAIEANSVWRGVSRLQLMENAGSEIVRELWNRNPPKEEVAIFAGLGSNGGDGLVSARHIINRGVDVNLILMGDPKNIKSPDSKINWESLSQIDQSIEFQIIKDSGDIQKFDEVKADVIIDAMLGTGVGGTLREPINSAVNLINHAKSYKVAVDIPTGLDPSTGKILGNVTKCDLTIAFHDIKPGLEGNEKLTGPVKVVDIGVPKSAEKKAGPGDVNLAVPHREIESHKGQNGKLLIIGGGSRYVGAPALTGLSALRAGVDLATIAAPSEAALIIRSFSPDLITVKLPGNNFESIAIPDVMEEVGRSTALVIGPGLGNSIETKNAVIDLARSLKDEYCDMPVLFDADGLKLIADNKDILEGTDWVLTPHAVEFELLSGGVLPGDISERIKIVSSIAKELKCNILLKSSIDICANSDGRVITNDTGNPGMTVGGTGDVMAGIVGAFLARKTNPLYAMSGGAFICGRAGDLYYPEAEYGFTANDVKDNIPSVILETRKFW